MKAHERSLVCLLVALGCAPDQFVSMGSDARSGDNTMPAASLGGEPNGNTMMNTGAGASAAGTQDMGGVTGTVGSSGGTRNSAGTTGVGVGGCSYDADTDWVEARTPL